MPDVLASVLDWIDDHLDDALARLEELLRIPSVGTDVVVWGFARQNEIDEIAWCPLVACG